MKKILSIAAVCLLGFGILPSCDEKLIEEPKSILTPAFFSTAQGFRSGLDAAYAGTRMFWGNQDLFTITVIGTDEFFTGQDGNNNINKYNSNYLPNNGQVTNTWTNCYTFINTCNGLVDNAEKITGIDETEKKRMVAEAKFLRANFYFILVQFWGDVTLNKTFQSLPSTSASRSPMAEVYDFIIEDLNEAVKTLPASPVTGGVLPGKATAAAAKHLLAKVYLTRAGSVAAKGDDYKNAHTIATGLIESGASLGLGLLQDFGQVHAEGNEGSREVLWTVQHTSNLAYNGPNNSGGADNVLNHMWVPQYENQPGMKRDVNYGRPYIRCVPTRWLTDTVFADRTNDTRYGKTFQTVWYSNNAASISRWPATLPPGAPANAQPGGLKFSVGDTAIYMPGKDVSNAAVAAAPYLLIPPKNYTIRLSPTMFKYFDTKRADLNYPSIRPVIVYRLAETYLIAAEALLMDGQAGAAVPYINAVRERAAYPGGNAQVMRVKASDLTLDFILDERSRELCGENMRWWDLVRTGKLVERVKKHNLESAPNIQSPKHLLRPIPQNQVDAVVTGDPYPQNPGW
ncbi:RagB/SusD family nutrient uptake outer membrane protein [Dyadobacter sp. CY261]|uniref:RagB/SusD family nutrient uptake outer membrane protein n=1 Tax=Dyadobacter sp. CY261 TaxID=2907203 RepID=UPI001F1C68A6|nr:RagB/SusD family nutrient uptake outer membrane protein [Dyadobacter sp. CY261]MCF0072933.1 RagB/SusD family nutrient uptake outer membrane protein [Dyadobacter sp. CY261]